MTGRMSRSQSMLSEVRRLETIGRRHSPLRPVMRVIAETGRRERSGVAHSLDPAYESDFSGRSRLGCR